MTPLRRQMIEDMTARGFSRATHASYLHAVTELARFHRAHKRKATVTTVRPPARFGNLTFAGDTVTNFHEKPEEGEGWINGGFFVLNRSAIDTIDDDSTVWEREPVERLVATGDLVGYRHFGFWSCMDTLKEKQMLDEMWESGQAPWKIWDDRPVLVGTG